MISVIGDFLGCAQDYSILSLEASGVQVFWVKLKNVENMFKSGHGSGQVSGVKIGPDQLMSNRAKMFAGSGQFTTHREKYFCWVGPSQVTIMYSRIKVN